MSLVEESVREAGAMDSTKGETMDSDLDKENCVGGVEGTGEEPTLVVPGGAVMEDLKGEISDSVSSLEVISKDDTGVDEEETMEVGSNASMGSFEEVEAAGERKDMEDIAEELEDSFESGGDDNTLLQDADGAITFKMSLQKRLNELHDAFENFGQGGLSLENFWCLYFETYVEPVGWRALWKQRDESSNNDGSVTLYKAIETVMVTQVNCANLSARVQRDDGSSISVPMSELHPLAQQENSFLSMKVTAKCIDNYRFFLNHLVFPWDSENADRWYELHLESRIQFYYDIQSGSISETMATEIRELIQEAKLNHAKIDKLEDKIGFADTEDDIIDEDLVSEMLPVHMRQEEIKARLQMLENPLWRNILNKHKIIQNRSTSLIQEKAVLVLEAFSAASMKVDLDFISSRIGETENIKIISSLQEALERCQVDSQIFIKPGIHKISGLGNLEEGGSIIGIPDSDETPIIIEPKDAGDVWMVTNTDNSVSLQNVVIRVTSKWSPPTSTDEDESISVQQAACSIALLVLRGELKLDKVTAQGFLGDNGVSCDEQETVGLKALEQGSVLSKNLEVRNFMAGLVIREQAKLSLNSAQIENCIMGIETNPGGRFELSKVGIHKCQKFGIIVYSPSEMKSVMGGLELLQTAESVQNGFVVSDVTFQDCTAGQVCVCSETVIMENEVAVPQRTDD